MLQAGFNGVEAGAEGPYSKKSKASYLINYRYSIFELMSNIGFEIGGIVSIMGFSVLAVLWLFTSFKGYLSILKRKVAEHENWMVRSYALCFAGVTLRLWIPFFLFLLDLEFLESYKIISWLCWVPNLLVAEILIYSKPKQALIKGVT